jgi:3-deoxy-manno-octulosonate cytidylyltransferase (CMP-KDO synthetase)
MGDVVAVIPARFASTRLPGKPLLEIAGKPVIRYVWEATMQAGLEQVIIATDDARIADATTKFGAEVCMTARNHPSGTDRLGEVAERYALSDATIVVNVQGDEPLMPPEYIRRVAEDLAVHTDCAIATLATAITDTTTLFDENVVKVITNSRNQAMYFSRAVIPWVRGGAFGDCAGFLRHIGLYAYRAKFLRDYADLSPAWVEEHEKLEQLRALWHGYTIYVNTVAAMPGPGIDTQEDFEQVAKLLAI